MRKPSVGSVDCYVVRVYRHDRDGSLVGIVEDVVKQTRVPFHDGVQLLVALRKGVGDMEERAPEDEAGNRK